MKMAIADAILVWERPNYHSSAAICRCIDEGLRVSGLKAGDIDVFDFYS